MSDATGAPLSASATPATETWSPLDGLPVGSPDVLTLYLVRHGRTLFNTEGRMQGWSDSELTDEGRAGVEAAAGALRSVPIGAAYSSPSGRTLATASAILAHHPAVALTRHDGLRELHFGDDEARPEVEVLAERDPGEIFAGVLAGHGAGFPGGETGREYLGRVARAFLGIESGHRAGESVLVVSHGVTLMSYLLLGARTRLRPLANASVSVVEIDAAGRRTVRVLGHDPTGALVHPGAEPLLSSHLRLEDVAGWT